MYEPRLVEKKARESSCMCEHKGPILVRFNDISSQMVQQKCAELGIRIDVQDLTLNWPYLPAEIVSSDESYVVVCARGKSFLVGFGLFPLTVRRPFLR